MKNKHENERVVAVGAAFTLGFLKNIINLTSQAKKFTSNKICIYFG